MPTIANTIRHLVLPLCLLAASAAPASAECTVPGNDSQFRWRTPLGAADVYGPQAKWPTDRTGAHNNDPKTWPFTTQRWFYQQVIADTPEEACLLFAKYFKHDPENFPAGNRNTPPEVKLVGTTGDYSCTFDTNGNGKIDASDRNSFGSPGNNNIIQPMKGSSTESREPMCDYQAEDRGVDGYAGAYGGSFQRGSVFSTTQKNKIKALNNANPDYGLGSDELHSDAYDIITRIDSDGTFTHLDREILARNHTNTPDSPEIDHLIPRVDKYGCGCGRNSPENALVISRELNGSMSNDSSTYARCRILQMYTTANITCSPYVYRSGGDDETGENSSGTTIDPENLVSTDDEAQRENEVGGCSVDGNGGSGALALVGLAVVAKVKRRRRDAAKTEN